MSHRFFIAVCQGRMCTALGGDALAATLGAACAATAPPAAPCTVTRGGCYGLCELAPNVVVRRVDGAQPDLAADRLTLTHAPNETVYSLVGPDDAVRLVASHAQQDAVFAPATRARRETQLPPKGEVAARIRALRARRSGHGSTG